MILVLVAQARSINNVVVNKLIYKVLCSNAAVKKVKKIDKKQLKTHTCVQFVCVKQKINAHN